MRMMKTSSYWDLPPIEHRDFLDCLKSRQKPAYHVEAGHRLSSALHLGHIAVRTGKTVKWDPDKEAFKDASPDIAQSLICRRPARDWAAA